MNRVKCVSINSDTFDNLKDDIENNLKIYNLQSYFPIMSLYFKFYNESKTNFTLKNNNYLTKINSKIEFENNDSYIKHFFNCEIKDYYNGNTIEKKIFLKYFL